MATQEKKPGKSGDRSMMSKNKEPLSAEIALDLPLLDTYHYSVPVELRERLQVGMRVLVPAGPRRVTGYFLGFSEAPEGIELKDIEDLLDDEPLFPEEMLELFRFTATYLFSPLGEVIRSALPSGINIESKRTVSLTETGELARSGEILRGPKDAIVKAIPMEAEVSVKQILQSIPGVKHYHFRELVRDGFLRVKEQLSKPRASMKKIKMYRVVAGVSLARRESLLRRSPKQRALMEFLEEREPATVEQIREFGTTFRAILNGLLSKGLVDFWEKEVSTDPFFASWLPDKGTPVLTEQQETVLEAMLPGLEARRFQPFLLHGVTGSGKTEVYIRLILRALELERQAIVLVPEISLTPQFVANFRARLGDRLTVLHSRLSGRERLAQWWRILRGEVSLVIGARSAIFAPFSRLGVIIVDEEQENSYKQEGSFPYHARNLALVRGKHSRATVVLGSATPAMESFTHGRQGKWGYLRMSERIQGRALPEIEIIDLRQVATRAGGIISPQLQVRIQETLDAGQQVILFLNRRGYHASFLCSSCGYNFRCLHCSVSLTYHRSQGLLICHYCGYAEVLPQKCPQCHQPELERLGLGTEKVEETVCQLFPEARVQRMDRDTTGKKGSLESIVKRFALGELDILIGTQMVAKGHDFPGVTLVGVLMADMGLNLPDFRSGEKSFQLLTQVAGRAGRGEAPGRVVIQTFNPEHPSIQFATQHDYLGFYEVEHALRRDLGYPPFGWLVSIRFEGLDMEQTRAVAEEVGAAARDLLKAQSFPGVVFLGPAPAPVERIKRKFRWQMLFKGADRRTLHAVIWAMIEEEELPLRGKQGVKITIDTDPVQML